MTAAISECQTAARKLIVLNDFFESAEEDGAGRAKFGAVCERELAEDFFAAGRDGEEHLAAIGGAAAALDKTFRGEAASEFDGGVVLKLEAFGENADRGALAGRETFDREHGLVLLGLEAGGTGGLFAEAEEAADFVAQIGECVVVHSGLGGPTHGVD